MTCEIGVGTKSLGRAKDWLANEITEDFKRYARTEEIRQRYIAVSDDHAAYAGTSEGWEGWVVTQSTTVHYRLMSIDGDCDKTI